MIGLTPRLALTASAIGELTEALGRPPRASELAEELDMDIPSLALHLRKLVERGWLAPRHGAAPRTLVLLHAAPPPPDDCAIAVTVYGAAVCEVFARRASVDG